MNRILITALLLILCISWNVHGSNKIRMLILSGKNNHEWQKTTPYLAQMYAGSGLFDVEITEVPETLNNQNLVDFDVIVSNWSSFPDKTYRWPAAAENALIDFIRRGGGLVTLHAATTAFYEWPEFKKLTTGAWIEPTSHGKKCAANISIKNSEHPITSGMSDFTSFDELWMNAELNPGFKILATAVNENTVQAGLEGQPVISVMEYGKGRIVHNALGHEVRNMRNSGFQTLMLRGTEWAATGKVMQALPQELQPIATGQYKFLETDTSFALLNGKHIVWQYNFREKHQKPHFDPIFLGRNKLTCVAPDDHPWHAGQWFSWKYINDVNYWEYVNKKDYRSEGTTEIRSVDFKRNKDFSAVIKVKIVYHPVGKDVVLSEERIIKISAPRSDHSITMDYNCTFIPIAHKVELGRTPIEGEENGKIWGGYGGL